MMKEAQFRTLSVSMNYNLTMLNDPAQIANFERPSGVARAVASNRPGIETGSSSRRSRHELPITIGLLALVLLATGFAVRPQIAASRLATLEYPPIVVSVSGEVARPGTYELPWGARSQDAIRAAGGATKSAETSLLNPAAQLEDGEQLLVPGKAVTNAMPLAKTKVIRGERINLNTASLAQLEELPGVGPKFAARLIAGRPYSGFEDVDRVKGVGPKMLEKLKNLVRF
jgi:DNA uptake protein ComE-like DNA-binding protein